MFVVYLFVEQKCVFVVVDLRFRWLILLWSEEIMMQVKSDFKWSIGGFLSFECYLVVGMLYIFEFKFEVVIDMF